MSASGVDAIDRLGMTLFLAVAVHALAILGVGLSWEGATSKTDSSMMEVTLAYDEAQTPPDEADYLAEIDQDGGGVAPEAQIPSPLAGIPTPSLEADAPAEGAAGAPAQPHEPLITADAESAPAVDRDEESRSEPDAEQAQAQLDRRDAAAIEAAELTRRLSQPREPSKRFINARTRAHEAAAYMEAWTRKVEAVGNLNYPSEARRRGLSGRLILEVSLMPDGSIDRVRIVQPSAHRLLDEAAVRIVELGAPFAAIPDDVLGGYDRLVITRTWEFVDGRRVEAR